MSDDLVNQLREHCTQAHKDEKPHEVIHIYETEREEAADRIAALEAEVERLKEVLNEIAHSKFCDYDNTSPNSYGTGVTDGHRYCAKIARAALAEKGEG